MNIIKKRDQKIDKVLKSFIEANKPVKQGFAEIDIDTIYRKHMGPVVSGYTDKIVLKRDTLYINLKSAALKVELLHNVNSLKKLLNDVLGEDIIQYIKIK
jgi:hypothetical protein